MATYFSNAIGADGTGDTTVEAGKRHLPGQFGVSKRVNAFVTQDTADGDFLRMFSLPSSARIHRVWFAATDSDTTGVVEVGLSLRGTNHNGAAVDADLFASSASTVGGFTYADVFSEAGTLGLQDRGKTLWELADIGGGTYPVDPNVEFDFVITVTTGGGSTSTYYLAVDYQ